MKVTTNFTKEEKYEDIQETAEHLMEEAMENAYFEMCKNEKRTNPVLYALRDRVAGVITGSYAMNLPSQEQKVETFYSYLKAKTALETKLHEDICFNKENAWSLVLDTYDTDNCINNMIYFDFILYLERHRGIFYKNIRDNDYHSIWSYLKNKPSMPCLHTWSRYQFDTQQTGQRYSNSDDEESIRAICAIGSYLPAIDKCVQGNWRRLFIANYTKLRTHENYRSLYLEFITKEPTAWQDIYTLESFTGFLLIENMYNYFLPYLKEVGMSKILNKILNIYVEELAKIKHPFLRLYAFEMTKVSYSSNKELEIKFSDEAEWKSIRDMIIDIIRKINQSYTSKWENAKRRIDRHLADYWNAPVTEGSEQKEVSNVIANARNYIEKKLFYINGTPNQHYSSYYNEDALTMSDSYKDDWYTSISNKIYLAINN